MYVSFTYRCPDCGHTEDRFVRRDQMDAQCCTRHAAPSAPGRVGVTRALMVRLPAGTRTTFRFADRGLKR